MKLITITRYKANWTSLHSSRWSVYISQIFDKFKLPLLAHLWNDVSLSFSLKMTTRCRPYWCVVLGHVVIPNNWIRWTYSRTITILAVAQYMFNRCVAFSCPEWTGFLGLFTFSSAFSHFSALLMWFWLLTLRMDAYQERIEYRVTCGSLQLINPSRCSVSSIYYLWSKLTKDQWKRQCVWYCPVFTKKENWGQPFLSIPLKWNLEIQ